MSGWFLYLLELSDGKLYAGITTDITKRIAAHSAGRGARFTRGRGPVRLLADAGPFGHGEALRLEAWLKKQRRDTKREKLIALRAATAEVATPLNREKKRGTQAR